MITNFQCLKKHIRYIMLSMNSVHTFSDGHNLMGYIINSINMIRSYITLTTWIIISCWKDIKRHFNFPMFISGGPMIN